MYSIINRFTWQCLQFRDLSILLVYTRFAKCLCDGNRHAYYAGNIWYHGDSVFGFGFINDQGRHVGFFGFIRVLIKKERNCLKYATFIYCLMFRSKSLEYLSLMQAIEKSSECCQFSKIGEVHYGGSIAYTKMKI